MTKTLILCAALILSLVAAGPVLAETSDADIAAVLGSTQEACSAPAATAELPEAQDADIDLANELKVEAAGQPCNQKTCGARQFCCNFSCSICAPIGGGCTQQFCG